MQLNYKRIRLPNTCNDLLKIIFENKTYFVGSFSNFVRVFNESFSLINSFEVNLNIYKVIENKDTLYFLGCTRYIFLSFTDVINSHLRVTEILSYKTNNMTVDDVLEEICKMDGYLIFFSRQGCKLAFFHDNNIEFSNELTDDIRFNTMSCKECEGIIYTLYKAIDRCWITKSWIHDGKSEKTKLLNRKGDHLFIHFRKPYLLDKTGIYDVETNSLLRPFANFKLSCSVPTQFGTLMCFENGEVLLLFKDFKYRVFHNFNYKILKAFKVSETKFLLSSLQASFIIELNEDSFIIKKELQNIANPMNIREIMISNNNVYEIKVKLGCHKDISAKIGPIIDSGVIGLKYLIGCNDYLIMNNIIFFNLDDITLIRTERKEYTTIDRVFGAKYFEKHDIHAFHTLNRLFIKDQRSFIIYRIQISKCKYYDNNIVLYSKDRLFNIDISSGKCTFCEIGLFIVDFDLFNYIYVIDCFEEIKEIKNMLDFDFEIFKDDSFEGESIESLFKYLNTKSTDSSNNKLFNKDNHIIECEEDKHSNNSTIKFDFNYTKLLEMLENIIHEMQPTNTAVLKFKALLSCNGKIFDKDKKIIYQGNSKIYNIFEIGEDRHIIISNKIYYSEGERVVQIAEKHPFWIINNRFILLNYDTRMLEFLELENDVFTSRKIILRKQLNCNESGLIYKTEDKTNSVEYSFSKGNISYKHFTCKNRGPNQRLRFKNMIESCNLTYRKNEFFLGLASTKSIGQTGRLVFVKSKKGILHIRNIIKLCCPLFICSYKNTIAVITSENIVIYRVGCGQLRKIRTINDKNPFCCNAFLCQNDLTVFNGSLELKRINWRTGYISVEKLNNQSYALKMSDERLIVSTKENESITIDGKIICFNERINHFYSYESSGYVFCDNGSVYQLWCNNMNEVLNYIMNDDIADDYF